MSTLHIKISGVKAYLEPSQTSKMELLAKIGNGCYMGSKYPSEEIFILFKYNARNRGIAWTLSKIYCERYIVEISR